MEVYHYSSLVEPKLLTPRHYVEGLPSFESLAPLALGGDTDGMAALASELHQEGRRDVGKVVTELAYEHVRRSTHPEAVSRFDAVYAFENPIDAFEVIAIWPDSNAGNRWVWLCELSDDVKRSVCDVDQFFVRNRPSAEQPASWIRHWEQAVEQAEMYWVPDHDWATRELLIEGHLQMIRRIHLREVV